MSVAEIVAQGHAVDLDEQPDAPGLPRMIEVDGVLAPEAPEGPDGTDLDVQLLLDLALKLANTISQFNTEWAAQQLRLPLHLTEELYWRLKQEHLIEVLGQERSFIYRYSATQRGREHAQRLMEISGYVGPAPVSLASYTAMLQWQVGQHPAVELEQVRKALSPLILPDDTIEIAALAAASGRSLFLFGPPGNGKTSLGRALHAVAQGELWIPHCISVDSSIIRIFDPQYHELVETADEQSGRIDQRWLRVRRPFVVAGGEMTIEELDLEWSPSLRFYEAPPHLKANGGIFLIDDFGRQRMDPHDLLNRWIVPLEHQVDFLSLNTGQKIQVPFRMMLIVSTNLQVSDVADPAFLRRMGYRLHMDAPTPEEYARIFERYAGRLGVGVEPPVISRLLERYKGEGRELRSSEPRDLIERARDICLLRRQALELSDEVLNFAWRGYFGHQT